MTAHTDIWNALEEHRARATRVARARGVHPDEVEDCVQEAMTRVAAMDGVDLQRVGSLVTVVVANLAVDGHRARSRAVRLDQRLASRRLTEPSPDEAVCDRAEARWLWSLRDDLPERDRQVLELRAQGRSLSETAADLGVTYKAAENALGRARKRMRTAWAATAALLGILWGRRPRPATAMASLPVTVLAAATLTALGPAPSAPVPSPAVVDSTAAVVRTEVPAAPPRAEPAPPVSPTRPTTAPQPPAPAVDAPEAADQDGRPDQPDETAQVPVLQYEVGVTVERKDGGRTLVEEVEECLRQGPALGPDVVGCRP